MEKGLGSYTQLFSLHALVLVAAGGLLAAPLARPGQAWEGEDRAGDRRRGARRRWRRCGIDASMDPAVQGLVTDPCVDTGEGRIAAPVAKGHDAREREVPRRRCCRIGHEQRTTRVALAGICGAIT